MNQTQEQCMKAARQKQRLRDGTYSDDGPPAPTAADDVLIVTCRAALTMLDARPSPNGIGTCSTDMRKVARIIRIAARWTSCRHCGAICTDEENGPACMCGDKPPRNTAARQMMKSGNNAYPAGSEEHKAFGDQREWDK
jgi:hypothetical protein